MTSIDSSGARTTPDPPSTGAATIGVRPRPWALITLELLIAASALLGGIGLIWNDAIRMPNSWLEGTPFTSWVLPGVLLLLIVAGPMIIAAVLELRRSAWSTFTSVFAGAAQIGWIAAQLLIMQRYNVLQPVMMLCGLAVILLALWVRRDTPPMPRRTPAAATRVDSSD
jgi:hypothetical protein